MQIPSEVRPQRPLRWLADACEMASIGSRCTLVRWLYREILAVPGSTTYLMPGTVSEVSATLVASTTRRPRCAAPCLLVPPPALSLPVPPPAHTLYCSAADNRAYRGSTSRSGSSATGSRG